LRGRRAARGVDNETAADDLPFRDAALFARNWMDLTFEKFLEMSLLQLQDCYY